MALTAEAWALLEPGMDKLDALMVGTVRGWAQTATGCFAEALATFDEFLALAGGDTRLESNGLRSAVYGEYFGAHCMAALGRFDACWPRLNRGMRLARESGSPDDFNFSINTSVMSAFLAGGATGTGLPDLVQMSLECVEAADPQNLNTSLHAQLYLGTAHFLAGNPEAADTVMAAGLAHIQVAGTTLEWSSFYSAIHADTCRALGDIERACAQARAGIEFADNGGFRFQAALCRAALADALIIARAPVGEVEAVIAEIRLAIEETGGKSLLPRLQEIEVRLDARADPDVLIPGLLKVEARYRSMGALGHAERLTWELSDSGMKSG